MAEVGDIGVVKKVGGVRLVTHDDMANRDLLNIYSKPIMGWDEIPGLPNGYINPGGPGAAIVWSIVQQRVDGLMNDIYNQWQQIENPGCVVIARSGNRYGLIRNFRNVCERIEVSNPNYVEGLLDEGRWSELMASAGEHRWECPAGIAPSATGDNLEEIILKAAKIEAAEEAGYRITNARVVGRPNFNPAYFMHSQYVVMADIEFIGESKQEAHENIGKAKLFTVEEIRDLIEFGQMDDARSLAAFAVAGIHIPSIISFPA